MDRETSLLLTERSYDDINDINKNLKSNDIDFNIPDGIEIECERPNSIKVKGIDKQMVGQVAAVIRSYRPPEPYKGKGIRYLGEYIFRKEGKKK